MKINVAHMAKLANLPLRKEEIEKFETQLSSILDYFKKLNEVDTSNTQEASQVTGLETVTRDDTTTPSLSSEEVLSNAKDNQNGFFKVKAILEE